MIKILFLESEKDFAPEEKRKIESVVMSTASRVVPLLDINENGVLNIVIYPFVWYIRGKPWVGGMNQSKEWIELTIPPGVYLPEDLEGTVCHELHHAARGYSQLELPKIPLLESVFSEGLALAFEMEQIPQRTPPAAVYEIHKLKEWLPELEKEMWDNNYSHDTWFFGKGKPWWLGYQLGKYLVDQIFNRNPGLSSAVLAKANAKELLELSGGL